MKSAFYYVLKRKLIEKGSDGKPVFIEKETVFENENPRLLLIDKDSGSLMTKVFSDICYIIMGI